jgi:energy-coupling factor transporter ATP-binding protein EcfA2
VIRLEDLSFAYEGSSSCAVGNLEIQAAPGQIIGVAGAEGSGRTTLFRLLNGTAPKVFRGTVDGKATVAGIDPTAAGHAALGAAVASVFDDPDAQIVSLTVEEEVGFALVQRGVELGCVRLRVSEALDRVGLSGFEHRATSSLSGGQKQRLVAASAIALKPRVLLVDEGTSALDPEGAREFFSIMADMARRDGVSVLVIDRDLELLLSHCDFIYILDSGRVALKGLPRDIVQHPRRIAELGLRLPDWLELCDELKRRGVIDGELPASEQRALDLLEKLCAVRVSA